ncbi:MAG TPA: sugar porter family MFS transporter [Chloroflexota bacterium]
MAQLTLSQENQRAVEEAQPKSTEGDHTYSYVVAAVAALGGLLFGYDTGVISGAALFLTKDFHLTSFTEELAISSVLIGCILGAAVAGRMADVLSRKYALIILAAIFGVGAVLTSIAPSLPFFIAFRIIVGFGVGASSMVAPMYIAEMAPESIRGALVAMNQLMITIGIAVSYWVDLFFANNGMGWRPMFAVAVIPAAILGFGMLFLRQTPRWLASKGRWNEAESSLVRIGSRDVCKDLGRLRTSIKRDSSSSPGELLHGPLRFALLVGVGLAVFQQFVGINTVIYYAPTIFGYAGFKSASGAILATSVVGIVNVVATVVSLLLVDRMGRRPLLLWGVAGIVVTLTALGITFAIGPSNAGFLVLICLLAYIVSFAIGMGPVFWLMSAEVFPNQLRGTGQSISTVGNWAANLVVSISFLSLINLLGRPLTFWVYAVLGVITFLFVLKFVPETRGKTLEQIEAYWHNNREWEDEATEATSGSKAAS